MLPEEVTCFSNSHRSILLSETMDLKDLAFSDGVLLIPTEAWYVWASIVLETNTKVKPLVSY